MVHLRQSHSNLQQSPLSLETKFMLCGYKYRIYGYILPYLYPNGGLSWNKKMTHLSSIACCYSTQDHCNQPWRPLQPTRRWQLWPYLPFQQPLLSMHFIPLHRFHPQSKYPLPMPIHQDRTHIQLLLPHSFA